MSLPSPSRTSRGPAPVTALCVAVPGRARLRVEGLRNGEGVARMIETRLHGHPGVSAVQASLVTGNLLVLYAPARVTVRELIAEVGRARSPGRRRNGRGHIPARPVARGGEPVWHTVPASAAVRELEVVPGI